MERLDGFPVAYERSVLDDSAMFGHMMAYDYGDGYSATYEAMFCRDCEGWTVFLIFDDEPERQHIDYSSCRHDDVCPDCRTNWHPGCCGEHA